LNRISIGQQRQWALSENSRTDRWWSRSVTQSQESLRQRANLTPHHPTPIGGFNGYIPDRRRQHSGPTGLRLLDAARRDELEMQIEEKDRL
jgi:hypothetical protein